MEFGLTFFNETSFQKTTYWQFQMNKSIFFLVKRDQNKHYKGHLSQGFQDTLKKNYTDNENANFSTGLFT